MYTSKFNAFLWLVFSHNALHLALAMNPVHSDSLWTTPTKGSRFDSIATDTSLPCAYINRCSQPCVSAYDTTPYFDVEQMLCQSTQNVVYHIITIPVPSTKRMQLFYTLSYGCLDCVCIPAQIWLDLVSTHAQNSFANSSVVTYPQAIDYGRTNTASWFASGREDWSHFICSMAPCLTLPLCARVNECVRTTI